MEILQTKIYNKTDNFNLTKGQSYPDLKSTFIVHQKDNKHGKIYITDYNGYCIEIFDIELNQKIEDLIRNFDAYKLSVSQQFNQFKSDLQDYAVEKDSALKTELTEKITENKTSLDNLKKKLPKDLKIEGNKLKLILNDDTVLGDITITVSGQNTKIKEFKYDAGIFKIVDTEDNVFPSGINLTQLFAPKNHNHDTEYVKLDDSRITTQYLPLSWNRRNNKEIIKTQSDGWLRINEDGAEEHGVYFGGSVLRTDNQLQVGEGGKVFRTISENGAESIIIGNKIRIRTRDDNHIAFGSTEWTKLIYGEFAGIKIWNNADNNKIVLAGGGVKNISDLNIGGRNLLRGSADLILANQPYYLQSNYAGNGEYVDETFMGNKVLKLIHNWQGFQCRTTFEDRPMVISFWAKTSKEGVKFTGIVDTNITFLNGTSLISDGKWHRYSIGKNDGRIITSNKANQGFIEFYKDSGHIEEVYVSSFKIEYSSTPTDWSPAPEDLTTKNLYNTITDAHNFLKRDNDLHFGSGSNIANAPSISFYEMFGFTHSNRNWGVIFAKNIDEDDKTIYVKQIINGSYKDWFKLTEQQFEHGGLSINYLNDNKFRKTGVYYVTTPGVGSGLLVSFRAGGSTSTLELYKSHWSAETRLSVRNTIDGNRFNDDNGAFRELAWLKDVYREGTIINTTRQILEDEANRVIFVTNSIDNCALNAFPNRHSVTLRKTFDGGYVNFTCLGKNIIYTGDNTFHGRKGSTAFISIFDNDCYIDIKNI